MNKNISTNLDVKTEHEDTKNILLLKPHLRFRKGDVVCLRSDLNQQAPMTVISLLDYDDRDYLCIWMNSQRKEEKSFFPDEALKQYEAPE